MKIIVVILLLCASFLLVSCSTLPGNSITGSIALDQVRTVSIPELVEQLQFVQGKALPEFVAPFFTNEVVTIFITQPNGTVYSAYGKVENAIISEIAPGVPQDSTLELFTSQEVITNIALSEDILLAFNEALDNGSITYIATGFSKKIKFAALRFALRVS